MATYKSILDIEVKDDQFKAFYEKFQEYQDALAKMPAGWAEAGAEAKSTSASFEKIVAALLAQNELSRKTAAAQGYAGAVAQEQARSWHRMARDSKAFAGHIASATRSLLRWGTLTGVISGLLGAGGLFGIERLASTAAGARRSSLGLGLNVGEQRAFGVDFGRVVDPDSFLGAVNESLHDVTKRVGLIGAGLTSADLKGKDTAQVAAELLPQLKRIADQTPDAMMAQVLHARHLDQFISLQDFERLKNTSPQELQSYTRQFQTDTATLALNRDQLKAWQDFRVQLTRAGQSIETTFIRDLSPLAPELGQLSAGFTKVIDAFANSPTVKGWIDAVASGLQNFAKYIDTPQFGKDVVSFTSNVGELVAGVRNLVTEFVAAVNYFKGFNATMAGAGAVGGAIVGGAVAGPAGAVAGAAIGGVVGSKLQSDPTQQPPRPGEGIRPPGAPPVGYGGPPIPGVHKSAFVTGSGTGMFAGIEQQNGLRSGVLNAVYQTESGGGKYLVSPAGALGPFQFMPATARELGITDPYDLGQSARGAGQYLAMLKAQFGGDLDKALAAYNWGAGNLSRDIARYGSAWREHLPQETFDYINRVHRFLPTQAPVQPMQQRSPHVTVTVHNNTGGNAIVSASQLAV